jgi:hypothetical protein
MPVKEKIYKRLPGKGKKFSGSHTLWAGPDHLLSVCSSTIQEDYRRFYYRDIESIIIRKTGMGKIQNIMIFFFAGLFTLFAWQFSGIWTGFHLLMSGLFWLLLVFNLLRGPTVQCHLATAVQSERLVSLHRLRTARKTIEKIKLLIENVQGPLWPELLKNQPPKRSTSQAGLRVKTLRHESGNSHRILFILLIIDGLVTAADLFLDHIALTLSGNLIFLITGVFVIISLVRQSGSDIWRGARSITWATLGYFCLGIIFGYVALFLMIIKNPANTGNHWELIKLFASVSALDSMALTVLYSISVCSALGLGAAGLFSLMGNRSMPAPTARSGEKRTVAPDHGASPPGIVKPDQQ